MVNPLTLLFVIIISAWVFSTALRHPPIAAGFIQDDFFYYAKIASNIAAGQGSTFDGVTPTNGYHPLYLVLLIPGASAPGGLRPILIEIYLLSIAASLVTFIFARRIFAAVGSSVLLANALALFSLWLPFRMFFQCMEVTLTIPLATILLWKFLDMFSRVEITTRNAVLFGLIASLMVLSRLDSAFLVLLLLIGVVCERSLRSKLTVHAATSFALVAGLPILLYVVSNWLWFHTLMPISGMAKELRFSHLPSRFAMSSAVSDFQDKSLMALSFLALIGFALSVRRLPGRWRTVLAAAVVFPLVQCGVNSILSDWPRWGWYRFVFVTSLLGLLIMIAFWLHSLASKISIAQARAISSLVFAIGALLAASTQWTFSPELIQIAQAADELQSFAVTHPGSYAMGDRSGMVGWLLPHGLFQTEGLVEDREWLDRMHSQQDLVDALRARNIRYYIYTKWLWIPTRRGRAYLPDLGPPGCTSVIEPVQAGPTAPHMRSIICDTPVASFDIPASGVSSAKKVMVFDLTHSQPELPVTMSRYNHPSELWPR